MNVFISLTKNICHYSKRVRTYHSCVRDQNATIVPIYSDLSDSLNSLNFLGKIPLLLLLHWFRHQTQRQVLYRTVKGFCDQLLNVSTEQKDLSANAYEH